MSPVPIPGPPAPNARSRGQILPSRQYQACSPCRHTGKESVIVGSTSLEPGSGGDLEDRRAGVLRCRMGQRARWRRNLDSGSVVYRGAPQGDFLPL